jgi:hypothetical protein
MRENTVPLCASSTDSSVEVSCSLKIPTESILEQMIRDEETARQSQEYQDECTHVKDVPNGWLDITAKLQEIIASKYGFVDPVSNTIAVHRLRTARHIYPENPVFKTPLYVRNNKARQGEFVVGDKVPNIILHKSAETQVNLTDLLNDVPTFIFAGSHTWQPFRANLGLIEQFYEQFSQKCQIFIIYITEAHAADVWNIGLSAGTINYSHKTIEDRMACIEKFAKEFTISTPIYADNMNDDFEMQFAAWPFRFYVVKDGKFLHIGEPDESTFDITVIYQYV